MKEKNVGTEDLFVYRKWGQNSLQFTKDFPKNSKPLIIPRTGTAAPIGGATMQRQPIKRGR